MRCSSKYSGSDEEHLLIARYAWRLASPVVAAAAGASWTAAAAAASREEPLTADIATQEATVQQLLQKNRQIAAEIEQLKRLRQEAPGERAPDAAAAYVCGGGGGLDSDERQTLCADLLVLKQHKSELEEKMGKLRQSRKDLVEQLESLMRLLRERGEAAALSASLSRSRSPEPPRVLVSDGSGSEASASPAPRSPRSPCPGPVGAKHAAAACVGGAAAAAPGVGRANASPAVSGELLGAVGEISAAVADLVKEITRSPASALPASIPERS